MPFGFVSCGPNEALVVSGCCYSRPYLVPGGRVFVWPSIHRVQKISLNTMTIQIDSPKVYTIQGVPISVTGIAQVKIQGQNAEMLMTACEQFLGKTNDEIREVALHTLEGHQRAIMGMMTVEEIYRDRRKFSQSVFEVASSDLVNMGISVVSYTIKDLRDEEGYLLNLGLKRTAEVKRDARIGEAIAKFDSQTKTIKAEQTRMESRLQNDQFIAKAKRDFELKKASYDIDVRTRKAEADSAYKLQEAMLQQKIKEEEMKVLVVEREQETKVQEQEIQRREKELDATVRRPADAEKYRLETLAAARHKQIVMEAEAEAESIELKGKAEAEVLLLKAKAEAEQMQKKAEAWKEYKKTALIDMFLETLPKVAAEIAAPLTQTKKITMVSTNDSPIGAAKITDEVVGIMNRIPDIVKTMTGVDLAKKPQNVKKSKLAASGVTVAVAASRSRSNSHGAKTTPKKSKEFPAIELNKSMTKLSVKDPLDLYKKERGALKEQLNLIIVGHVDAGKSTLMGRLLCDLGRVSSKLVHKYEQESRRIGKPSFMYAWVLDESNEERTRGVTMDVGRSSFETRTKCVTLLDAPGHRDFIPNMITGATQADVAVLVLDASTGNFERGFECGGQTREHALLVRSLGVQQLAVAVNKLDMIDWSEERFNEIVTKTRSFLKQIGFRDRDRDRDLIFVPCSGLYGENLTRPSTQPLLTRWYSGPCLLDVIDNFTEPLRPIQQPFRFSISDIFKNPCASGFSVSGRVETGLIGIGDRVIRMPPRDKSMAVIKSLTIGDEQVANYAFAGDQATIALGGTIEMDDFSIGNLLCTPNVSIPICTCFEASILIFAVRVPIIPGFSTVLHHQALAVPATVRKLIAVLNKATGETEKKKPRCLMANTRALVEIEVERAIAIETFTNCKELGRIMLREQGSTIAAGLVTKIS